MGGFRNTPLLRAVGVFRNSGDRSQRARVAPNSTLTLPQQQESELCAGVLCGRRAGSGGIWGHGDITHTREGQSLQELCLSSA